jgi:hypothetical protein
MRLAKWVFLVAGLSGIVIVAPLYFLEEQAGRDYPPPINHPEFFYGFAGVTLAWQVMFLVIASDPVRFRLAMLPAMLEKAGFVIAVSVLYAMGRVQAMWLGAATMDGAWWILFTVAYLRTPKEPKSEQSTAKET